MSSGPHVTKPKQRRLSRAASVNSSSNPASPILANSTPGGGGGSGSNPTTNSFSSSSDIIPSPNQHPAEGSSTSTYFSLSPKPVHATPNGLINGHGLSYGTTSAHSTTTHGGAERASFSPTYTVNQTGHNVLRSLSTTERRDGKRHSFGLMNSSNHYPSTVGEEKERRNGILYDGGSSEESGGSARNSAENPAVGGGGGGGTTGKTMTISGMGSKSNGNGHVSHHHQQHHHHHHNTQQHHSAEYYTRGKEKEKEKEKEGRVTQWDRDKLKKEMHLGYIPTRVPDEGVKAPGPKIFGVELKWISLLTLALQNAFLTVIMHYSRILGTPYSAPSAVLMNEILKGTISLLIALHRVDDEMTKAESHALSPALQSGSINIKDDVGSPVETKPKRRFPVVTSGLKGKISGGGGARSKLGRNGEITPAWVVAAFVDEIKCFGRMDRWSRLFSDVLSGDCWKLGIPAVLYVIQNNLQYVAASNLDVATFQVTYQMKILTTAFFSVILLRKRLTTSKWLSLLLLAVGVGIVQIQSNNSGHSAAKAVTPSTAAVMAAAKEHMAGQLRSEIPEMPPSTDEIISSSGEMPIFNDRLHQMKPWKGFVAVMAACMTSGLAGVYFEMVLKGSKADLWTRNVQLSLFSLLPALLPVLFGAGGDGSGSGLVGLISEPFRNFGWLAWGTILTQVFGGLVTALVIKYSDNILKGFATSLSIVLSFLASVGLFNYPITPAFVLGSSVVLTATWMYNQPPSQTVNLVAGLSTKANRQDVATMGSPVSASAPIIGETPKPSRTSSVVSLLGLTNNSNGGSRAGTPALQPFSTFTVPVDYMTAQPYRSSSPGGVHTAPPSPHYHTPNLSSHSSSSNLFDQTLTFTKPTLVNGTKGGGGGGGAETGQRKQGSQAESSARRPVLEVETSVSGEAPYKSR